MLITAFNRDLLGENRKDPKIVVKAQISAMTFRASHELRRTLDDVN